MSKKKRNTNKKTSKKGGSSQNCVYNKLTSIMEGQCPGLKYLNEIRHTLGNQDSNSVYMVFGHGCDLELEVLIVPKDCQYYTTVACGKSASHNEKIYKDFFNNTMDLSKPEKYDTFGDEALDEFDETVIATGEQKLYKRVTGDSYVNNKNWTFLEMGSYCGLRKMGDVITNIIFGKDSPPYFLNLREMLPYKVIDRPYTLEMYYLQHYAGSIFPTTYQVCKLLHENYTERELNNFKYSLVHGHNKFKELIINNFSIDYDSIMEVFKGIHINFACRPICRGTANTVDEIIPRSAFVALRRKKSSILPINWSDEERK
jgi:hypothetical protein